MFGGFPNDESIISKVTYESKGYFYLSKKEKKINLKVCFFEINLFLKKIK